MERRFSPVAWVNGVLRPFESTGLPLWDLGVVAGASITEMARTYRHRPFRIDQHIQRLVQSCSALGFPQPWNAAQLETAVAEVLERNIPHCAPEADLGIVLFQTAGANATYLGGEASVGGSTVVHTFPLPFSLWKTSFRNGVRLQIPPIRQIPDDCLPVQHKIRNRLHWWLADQEAAQLEPGAKALLLDRNGHVTETSTSCFFIVQAGRVLTAAEGVLNSMSRRIVAELCGELGIPFEFTSISLSMLEEAQEWFLSSTPVGLLPVATINGERPAGSKATNSIHAGGPVFSKILTAWSKLVAVDLEKQICESSAAT